MLTTSFRLSAISVVIAMLSLTCQILTARSFGARHLFDVYLFAMSIPFLVTGAATGSLSQAFVPRLLSARHDRRLYQDSVQALLVIAILAAALVAFGGISLTKWSMSAVAHVFSPPDRSAIVSIARVAWLSAGLALFVSALTAVHHAEKSFLLPAVTGTSLYLGMIAALVGVSSPRTPILLVWGMLGGCTVSVLVLLPRVLQCLTFAGIAKTAFAPVLSGVGRIALVITANCAFSGLAPVEAMLAPKFGPGALSYLGYAERLIIAMGAMVVAGPSVLLVPAVAEAWLAKDEARVHWLAQKTIAAVTVISALLGIIFCILRLPVISLLLQRGAFDAATTRGVAETLPWMLVGSVAMFGTQIAYRILYGQNMHAFPAVVGLIVPGVYLSVALLLGKSLGFQGICIAYAVSWWLAFLVLLLKVFAVDRGPIWGLNGTPVWGTLMALTVTAATVLWGQKLLLPSPAAGGKLGIGVRCITVAGAGIASFALTGALIWPRSDVRQILLSRRAPARRK